MEAENLQGSHDSSKGIMMLEE